MEVQFRESPQNSEIESRIPISSLIPALDLAAQSTKTLILTPATISSLRSAHRLIGSFLSQFPPDNDDDEQMLDRNDEEQEEESKIMEDVEEGMRECVLQSKRRKRHVSPSSVVGRATTDRADDLTPADSVDRRRSAIDLVFQFHA